MVAVAGHGVRPSDLIGSCVSLKAPSVISDVAFFIQLIGANGIEHAKTASDPAVVNVPDGVRQIGNRVLRIELCTLVQRLAALNQGHLAGGNAIVPHVTDSQYVTFLEHVNGGLFCFAVLLIDVGHNAIGSENLGTYKHGSNNGGVGCSQLVVSIRLYQLLKVVNVVVVKDDRTILIEGTLTVGLLLVLPVCLRNQHGVGNGVGAVAATR